MVSTSEIVDFCSNLSGEKLATKAHKCRCGMEKGDIKYSDAFRRYLDALSRLHWLSLTEEEREEEGSIYRLPGGGPPPGPSSCYCEEDIVDDLISPCTPTVPGPRRVERPFYVVFDEDDPVSALEKSFDLGRTFAGAQTIYVINKAVQTEESMSRPSITPKEDVSTQYDALDIHIPKLEKQKTIKKRRNIDENEQFPPTEITYYSPKTLEHSKPNAIKPTHNVLQKFNFWRRSLSAERPAVVNIDSEKERKLQGKPMEYSENNAINKGDKSISEISRRLSDLQLRFHMQEAKVKQLQESIDLLKEKKNLKSRKTDLIIISDASTSTHSIPIKSGLMKNFISPRDDTSSQVPSSSPFLIRADRHQHPPDHKSCSCAPQQTKEEPKKVDSSTQANLDSRCPSSQCLFCKNMELTVLDDLVCGVVKLIGERDFQDVMLNVLLRSDDVYHVNVQLKVSKRNLGCILASPKAIEKALDQGFFKQILTYSVSDTRNTIKPVGPSFGIPFEFITKNAKSERRRENESEYSSRLSRDVRVNAFMTNVLRLPNV